MVDTTKPTETNTKAETEVLAKTAIKTKSEKLYKDSIEQFQNALDIEPPGSTYMSKIHLNLLILLIIIISYFLGRFNFSFVIVLGFSYCISFIFNRRYKKFKRSITTLIYRSSSRQKVKNTYESVEWINYMVSRVWHVIEPEVSKKVFQIVNPILQEKCPPFLSQLKLKSFTLGSNPPFLGGICFFDNVDQDVIQFDCEMCFVPLEVGQDTFSYITRAKKYEWNSKIILVARLGTKVRNVGLDLPILVKGISFKGLCRIKIKLVPDILIPLHFVEVCFMEVPEIDFTLVPLKTVDLMDVPGLSSWIHSVIKTTLKNVAVNPNSIILDLRKKEKKSFISGMLHVFIRDIRFKERESVTIEVGIDGRRLFHTRRIEGDNCIVGEYFYIIIGSMDDLLDIKIIQHSMGKDNFGEGYVDLKKIKYLKDHVENLQIMKKGNVRSVASIHLHYVDLKKKKIVKKDETNNLRHLEEFHERKEDRIKRSEKEWVGLKKLKTIVKMKIVGIEDLKGKSGNNRKIYDSFFTVLVSPKIEEERIKKEPYNPLSFVTGTVTATTLLLGGAISATGNALSSIIQEEDKQRLLPSSDETFYVYESKVINETNSPFFNEEFEFIVRDRRNDFVYIRVNDNRDGKVIGKLDIPVKELKEGDETYRLKDCQGGKIKIVTELFYQEKIEKEGEINNKYFQNFEKAVRISIEGLLSMYDDGIFYCIIMNKENTFLIEPFCIGDLFLKQEIIIPVIGNIMEIKVFKQNEKEDDFIGDCSVNLNDLEMFEIEDKYNNRQEEGYNNRQEDKYNNRQEEGYNNRQEDKNKYNRQEDKYKNVQEDKYKNVQEDKCKNRQEDKYKNVQEDKYKNVQEDKCKNRQEDKYKNVQEEGYNEKNKDEANSQIRNKTHKRKSDIKKIPLVYKDDENGTILIKCDYLPLLDYKGTGEAADNFKIVQVRFNSFNNVKEEFYIEFKKNNEIFQKSMRSEGKVIESTFLFLVGKAEIRAKFCGGRLGTGEKLGNIKKIGDCLIPKRQMKETVMLDENNFSANVEIQVKGCNYKLKDKKGFGELKIFIRSANNLLAFDSNGKSDPYVKIFLNGEKVHKTDRKRATVNPVYNEVIELSVDRRTDILRIEIFDFNQFENNKLMAFREIPLCFLKEEMIDLELKMIDARTFKKNAGELIIGFDFGNDESQDKKNKSVLKRG